MKNFTQAHNDYLDHDRHSNESAGHWSLYKLENGNRTFVARFDHEDGKNVMGDDMHEWMLDRGHYIDHNADQYDWDGDSSYVAIMTNTPGLPDFAFEWVDQTGENA